MTKEQWDKIISHTIKKAAEFGREIMDGRIDASPYRMGDKTGCDFCRFQGICGVEQGGDGKTFRELQNMTEQDIWEEME